MRQVIYGGGGALGAQYDFPQYALGPAKLTAITGRFIADATVGNRQIFAEVRSADGALLAWVGLGQVPAGTSMDFCLTSSLSCNPAAGAMGGVHGGVPSCGLWPGTFVRLVDFSGVAGPADEWSEMVCALCIEDG